MRFRFLGTEIYVSFLFIAVISFMLCIDKTGLCLPTLFAVLIHESGHLFAMWICECQPKSVRLVPTSIEITRGFSRKKYGETVIALLGPLANVALFLSLYINFRITKSDISLVWAVLNLVVALFNLLPVSGLDGGVVLENILEKRLQSKQKAEKVVKLTTLTIGFSVLILGAFSLICGELNISVIIVGIYIIICGFLRI